MTTLSDLKALYYRNELSLSDNYPPIEAERLYFETNSGLTSGSFTDHELELYKNSFAADSGFGKILAKNYMTSSSFEDGSTGAWAERGSSCDVSIEPLGFEGSNSIKVTSHDDAVGIDTRPRIQHLNPRTFPVFKIGDTVTLRVMVRPIGFAPNITVWLGVTDGISGNQYTPGTYNVSSSTADIWVEHTISWVAENDSNGENSLPVLEWDNSDNIPGRSVLFDVPTLTVNGQETAPFNGNTSTLTRWTGTENESISELVSIDGLSINDAEFAYYSGLSGLTPRHSYSLSDHQMQYFKTELGL